MASYRMGIPYEGYVTYPLARSYPKSAYSSSGLPKTCKIKIGSGFLRTELPDDTDYNGAIPFTYSGDGDGRGNIVPDSGDDYIDFYLPEALDATKNSNFHGGQDFLLVQCWWMDGTNVTPLGEDHPNSTVWYQYGLHAYISATKVAATIDAGGGVEAGAVGVTLTPTGTRAGGASFGGDLYYTTTSTGDPGMGNYDGPVTVRYIVSNTPIPLGVLESDSRWVDANDGAPITASGFIGQNYVVIRVRNGYGMWNDASWSLTVNPPVAEFTWQIEPDTVTFDGAPSHAYEGRTVEDYDWQFKDEGGNVLGTQTGIAPDYDLPEGDNTVCLLVTDSGGLQSLPACHVVSIGDGVIETLWLPSERLLVGYEDEGAVKVASLSFVGGTCQRTPLSTQENARDVSLDLCADGSLARTTQSKTNSLVITMTSKDGGKTWV